MQSFLKIPFVEAAVDMTAFGNVINPIIVNIVYPIIGLLFGIAIVMFVYGVLQLVLHGADPSAREKGQSTIMYGTIGMFIMVSAWGIIYLVSNTIKGL
ncbi:MAG: hypothetical protein WCS89_00350 [Candidatus Paceibacterota bacterium]|jgi:hypothetical protein